MSDTWTRGPRTINQLRLTYIRNIAGRQNVPETSLGDLGSTYRIQGPPSLPRITVSGYFDLQQAIGGPAADNFYQVRDILSLTRGRHTLKMGVEGTLSKVIQDTTLDNYGVFTFNQSVGNNALAGFLMGTPQRMKQDSPITKIDNSWSAGIFFQDDFRLHPRLMLNLGLRYELQTPYTDPLDRKLTFVPGAQSTIVPLALPGLLFAGDPGIPRAIVSTDRNNYSPRIGIAWDPFGNGKTSLRAGFGIFYASMSANSWNTAADNQPFTVRQEFDRLRNLTLSDPYADLPGGLSPFPYNFSRSNPKFILPATIGALGADFRWPYTYQTNFSLQRQLTSTLTVTGSYVNSISHKVPFAPDVNYAEYRPGATTSNVDARRPYAGFKGITMVKAIVNSAYHGFQLNVDRRMSRNVSFKGFYTFSKGLESADSQSSTVGGGAQNHRNLRAERARTDADRKHNFVMSGIWQLRYFHALPAAPRAVLGGWTLSAVAAMRSGTGFTVTSGEDNNRDGSNNDRANYIGGDPRLDSGRPRADVVARWFHTAAFGPNPVGTDGNTGRRILDAPGLKNLDLGIARDFRLREGWKLQVRGDMTNALNLVNLNGPNAQITSPLFGMITGARSMREAQLELRVTF